MAHNIHYPQAHPLSNFGRCYRSPVHPMFGLGGPTPASAGFAAHQANSSNATKLYFNFINPPVDHFYSPADSDDEPGGGGFASNQATLTDQYSSLPTLPQASTESPPLDGLHMSSDDQWAATPHENYADDAPYIPPTIRATHQTSNARSLDNSRPPLVTPPSYSVQRPVVRPRRHSTLVSPSGSHLF